MVPPEWVEAIGNLPLPDSARSVAAGAALVISLGEGGRAWNRWAR